MFEFIKDMNLSAHGVDIESARAQRAEKDEETRAGRFIFGVKSKIAVSILAVLYTAAAIIGMVTGGVSGAGIFIDALLCAVALGSGVCVWCGNKYEIAAVGGIAAFILGLYIKSML